MSIVYLECCSTDIDTDFNVNLVSIGHKVYHEDCVRECALCKKPFAFTMKERGKKFCSRQCSIMNAKNINKRFIK